MPREWERAAGARIMVTLTQVLAFGLGIAYTAATV